MHTSEFELHLWQHKICRSAHKNQPQQLTDYNLGLIAGCQVCIVLFMADTFSDLNHLFLL